MTKTGFIAPDAKVVDSDLADGCSVFRGGVVAKSTMGSCSSLGDDGVVMRSNLGAYVSINRRNYVHDSVVGDLTYTGQSTMIHRARIGRFCSIAGGVEIGGSEHDMSRATTLPMTNFEFARTGSFDSTAHADLNIHCSVGSDVWIASHAVILGKANVGDGAVIGAGAVVTKDVPPVCDRDGRSGKGHPAQVPFRHRREATRDRMVELAFGNRGRQCRTADEASRRWGFAGNGRHLTVFGLSH